jgi:hypothetical protein
MSRYGSIKRFRSSPRSIVQGWAAAAAVAVRRTTIHLRLLIIAFKLVVQRHGYRSQRRRRPLCCLFPTGMGACVLRIVVSHSQRFRRRTIPRAKSHQLGRKVCTCTNNNDNSFKKTKIKKINALLL